MNHRDVKRQWYEALSRAHGDTQAVTSLAETFGALSVEAAYEVQRMLIEDRLKTGEHIVGWKVGATSRAVMEQLGIHEPIFGCMTSRSHFDPMSPVKACHFCRLGIEGEIAFLTNRTLRGPGVDNSNVMAATAGILGAVELVDCRIKDRRVTVSEAAADNALHGGLILGPVMRPLAGFDLRHEGVIISKNGRTLASACGVEALGNPVNVVSWLANKLSEFGWEIGAGELILTGSLTRFEEVEADDVMDVSFSTLGNVIFPVS